MAALMPQGKQQYFTAGGIPLVGGKVYTYAAGTTTPLATYTTAAASTPNANPVILDSRGEASIFFSAANYKIVVKDSLDSTIWTQDNLPGDQAATIVANLAASTGSSLVGHIPSGTGAVATTVQGKLREGVSVRDFGAVGDDTTDDYAAFLLAYTHAVSSGLTLVIPGGTYKLGTSWVISNSNVRIIPDGLVTLHFTNSGRALQLDGGAVSGSLDGVVFGGDTPIKVKGNASTTDVVFIRSVHHSNVNIDVKDGITACRVNFAVCTQLRVECSVNTGAFALQPTYGMWLDQRGVGEYVAACDIYPIIEGVSDAGIYGNYVQFTNFWGGTSEANDRGIAFSANCFENNVYGIDLEANTSKDISDSGNNNSYHGVRAGSNSATNNVVLEATCNGASFYGGYQRGVNVQSGATSNSFYGVAFASAIGMFGTVNSTTIAARIGCTLVNASAVVTGKYPDMVGEYGVSWTPAFASAGGGAQGAVTNADGHYSVVGKHCYVHGFMSIAKGTLGAGAVSVAGFPFGSSNQTNYYQYIPVGEFENIALGAGYTQLFLRIAPNSTVGTLIKTGASVVSALVNVADFPATMGLRFSGMYEIA